MKIRSILPGLLIVIVSVWISPTALAAGSRTEFDAQMNRVLTRINREAKADVSGSVHLADLIQREYGTREDELKWAVTQSMNWGEIVTLAYIQATTGRRFAAINDEDARRDFWTYAEKAGMNANTMVHSLEGFLKKAETERNSRIFERLRTSRRVQAMPDLGSGFGLFQEALDFRRIDSPQPTKVHTVATGKAKGEQ